MMIMIIIRRNLTRIEMWEHLYLKWCLFPPSPFNWCNKMWESHFLARIPSANTHGYSIQGCQRSAEGCYILYWRSISQYAPPFWEKSSFTWTFQSSIAKPRRSQDVNRAAYPYPSEEEEEKTQSDEVGLGKWEIFSPGPPCLMEIGINHDKIYLF